MLLESSVSGRYRLVRITRSGSDAFDRFKVTGLDRRGEPLVVPLVLVGVAFAEVDNGGIEAVIRAEVLGDRDRIP
jgi:hypothetical protein